MILKGSQRGGGMHLARHLMNVHDNDHVELHELRGFVSDDLLGAFKETQAISLGTKCSQFLFSLSLSPPELENVSIKEFEKTIYLIEKKIGLVGQPRAIIFHEKSGRRHAHCVWSRIDATRMRAINLPHFKLKLQDISRQLYLDHQWQMPPGLQNKNDADPLNYTLAEAGQAKRVKTDPQVLKAMFQKCWTISDSKSAFAHALKEQGFILAKGDRRGFVAVDREGEVYSISRWVGVKAKEVRARLGETNDLPDVEAAQALITVNISDEVLASVETTTNNYQSQLQKLSQKRALLIKEQRQARQQLKQDQKNRFIKETKARVEKLPTGLKATWSKLSGQYQKIIEENEAQIRRTKEREQAEQQQISQFQLKERQALQQEIRQLHFQQELATKTLWQEIGTSLRHLSIDPAQPLVIPIDEETLGIKEKVRRHPEKILDAISDKKEIFSRSNILRGLAEHIDEPTKLQIAIDKVFQSKELVEIKTDPSPRYTTREMQVLKVTPFKDICDQIDTVQLIEIRRQKTNWQRQASQDFAEQRTGLGLQAYEEKGFVKIKEDNASAIASLVEDYMSDMELHGVDSSRLALAHRRKDVHKINQTIRAALQSAGELNEEVLFQTVHGPRAFAKDDRILLTRNDRELGLRNGMLGIVESVKDNQMTIRLDSGNGNKSRCVTISPKNYHAFDHGYATTIHKSQGATVDRSFVLASATMDRHLTYVAMTRHKEDVNLYTDGNTLHSISCLDTDRRTNFPKIILRNLRRSR